MGKVRTPYRTPVKEVVTRSNNNRIVNKSLVAAFDELCKNGDVLQEQLDFQLLSFIRASAEWRKKYQQVAINNSILQTAIEQKEKEISGKDYQIRQARKFLDEEQKVKKEAEAERDELHAQLQAIKDLLLADGGKTLNNETLEPLKDRFKTIERISSLRRNKKTFIEGQMDYEPSVTNNFAEPQNRHESKNANMKPRMTMIQESSESLIDASDLTFDETQGDALDGSRPRGGKRRSSANIAGKRSTARKSAGEGTGIVAKTTVRVDQDGQTHAESFIETFDMEKDIEEKRKRRRSSKGLTKRTKFESNEIHETYSGMGRNVHLPSAPSLNQINNHQYDIGLPPKTPTNVMTPVKRTFSNAASVPSRQHSFIQKSVKVTEKCNPCRKRIKFGKIFLKCQDCEIICHKECKLQAPLPCIAVGNRTPTNKTGNYLADYASVKPPMIPPILMLCVKDVEERGIDEVGVYRVPGNEGHANEILDMFMKHSRPGEPPRFTKYDVHSVTSCIKKFLRSLKEPIIPLSLLQVFVDAMYIPAYLQQAISELPQPNRDTLAYLMIHLQTIAANHKVNKMDTDNLAMVLGPTIVGYSTSDPTAVLKEAKQQHNVMKLLLGLSSEYWSNFLGIEEENILGLKKMPKRIYKANENRRMGTRHNPDNQFFTSPAESADLMAVDRNRLATGAVARLARSKQTNGSKKGGMFQSPML